MLRPLTSPAASSASVVQSWEPSLGRLDLGRVGLVILATAAIMLAPPLLALAGAAGFVWLASRDRVWALAAVVVSVPFQPLQRPVGAYAFSPTEILIVLTTAGAIVDSLRRGLTRERDGTRMPPENSSTTKGWMARGRDMLLPPDRSVSLFAVLLVLAAVISLTASVTVHQSIQSLRVVIAEPIAWYFVASSAPNRRRLALILGFSLVVAGLLISLFGIWQYGIGDRIITAEADLRRIRGFYGSPNNLGLFLDRVVPLSVALVLWRQHSRVALVVVAVPMIVALVLTYSLGAWGAVAGALLVIAFLRGRRATLVGGLAALTGLAAVALLAIFVPRIGSHFDLHSSTSAIRLDVWQSGLAMLEAHPLRGIGLDNFLYYYQHGYRLASAWADPNLSHPHNLLLDFWLSLGVPGPILLLALLGQFILLARRAWRVVDLNGRGLVAGAVGGMTASVLHGIVDNSFFLPDLAVLFWVMFVIVAGVGDAPAEPSRD